MSKYSQLPRNTIALLTMRAQRRVDVQNYVNWAVDALVDGFDSRSLAILAGLDYGLASKVEAPDYFLRAVKELALPIPDYELAAGNWYSTDILYRKLGLSLPDKRTLLDQHLVELVEQIKEGVIDPVVGLERIYVEIGYVWADDSLETDYFGLDISDLIRTNATNMWEWEELRYYILNEGHGRYEKFEPEQIKKETIAFATEWLGDKESKFTPKFAIRVPLPAPEKEVSTQARLTVQLSEQLQKQALEKFKIANVTVFRKFPDVITDATFIHASQRIREMTIKIMAHYFLVFGMRSTVLLLRELMANINSLKERRIWIEHANFVKVDIVARNTEYVGQELKCEVLLRLPESQGSRQKEQLVRAFMNPSTYYTLEKQATVHIYSSKSDPYCFLVEGE